jgi:hypothetical protein
MKLLGDNEVPEFHVSKIQNCSTEYKGFFLRKKVRQYSVIISTVYFDDFYPELFLCLMGAIISLT